MDNINQKHLRKVLSANTIVLSIQYGFMPRRSTILQLLRTMDDLKKELDNGNEVNIAYIDFQKAFDSVPHQRLLGTKTKCGIQEKSPNWVRDFLSDRKQHVVFNESCSKWATVRRGIPQGTVIEPVLFMLLVDLMFN